MKTTTILDLSPVTTVIILVACFLVGAAILVIVARGSSRPRSLGYGALIPEENRWQVGMTRASISFVYDAEEYLKTCSDLAERSVLSLTIDRLKRGEMVFREHRSVEGYLHREV